MLLKLHTINPTTNAPELLEFKGVVRVEVEASTGNIMGVVVKIVLKKTTVGVPLFRVSYWEEIRETDEEGTTETGA